MYEIQKEEMQKIAPLFDGWNETMIWSCLQGCMGQAFSDDKESPRSAQTIVGDFCCFAGVPNLELVKNIPSSFPSKCILMVPQNEGWEQLIEHTYRERAEKFTRYAFFKEPGAFDREKLKKYLAGLSPEYCIKAIDEKLYNNILSEEWSKDLCSQFPNYSDFESTGIGFAALRKDNGELAGGASSYTVYRDGIEIEIDTKLEYRRKGLARACASRLILGCIEKGLYPSWDAANKESAALAQQLGYILEKEYTAYSVTVR